MTATSHTEKKKVKQQLNNTLTSWKPYDRLNKKQIKIKIVLLRSPAEQCLKHLKTTFFTAQKQVVTATQKL